MIEPSRWAASRAAILTLVIGVHGLFAAPVPHVVSRAEIENPVSAEEVATWADRLTRLGYTIDAAELGDRVVDVTAVIGGTHRSLKAPFLPLLRATGTGQGWALFANPDTHPGRLEIRVQRGPGAPMETLYLQLDPEHDWWRSRIAYRRLRGCWDAGGFRARPRGVYVRFSKWVSQRIFEANPEVTVVEVRTLRTHTTLPGEPADPAFEVRHVVRTPREAR